MLETAEAEVKLREFVFDVSELFPDLHWKVTKSWPLPQYEGKCKKTSVLVSSAQMTMRGNKFQPTVQVKVTNKQEKGDPNSALIPFSVRTKWKADMHLNRINRKSNVRTQNYSFELFR